MRNKRPSQAQRIVEYIRKFGSITRWEAMKELGVANFGARTTELKHKGVCLAGEWVEDRNRFGEKIKYMRYTIQEDPF